MRRRGMTLLELLVAITLGGVTVLLAAASVTAALEGRGRLLAARDRLDARENAVRTLTEWLQAVDIGLVGARPFDGRPDGLDCTVWQLMPGGWTERRTLRIALVDGRLVARTEDRAATFGTRLDDVSFAYLGSFDRSAAWVSGWSSPVSAPAAIRIVTQAADGHVTLLLLVGGRG
jgi:prepilin-type N-terminal cleavage/methylation domain-containing protein